MTNENLCPACGTAKDEAGKDKYLCFYCYHRGNHGTVKLLILDIFSNTSQDRLSIQDVVDHLNAIVKSSTPDSLEKIDIGKPFTFNDIKKLLIRYTKRERTYKGKTRTLGLGLLTAAKSTSPRPDSGGRKQLLYKITKKGLKKLKAYKKTWLQGRPLSVPKRFNKFTKHRAKFQMIEKYLAKASMIRGLLINNKYPTYAFILPRRRGL
jgi:hypothetical protein